VWEVPSNYKSRKKGTRGSYNWTTLVKTPPPHGCGSFQLVTFTKSWTFEAPGWIMMGPLFFFLQFFFFNFFLQRGFFGFVIPSVNSTIFFCQKIEQKNPGGGASGYSFCFWGQISVL